MCFCIDWKLWNDEFQLVLSLDFLSEAPAPLVYSSVDHWIPTLCHWATLMVQLSCVGARQQNNQPLWFSCNILMKKLNICLKLNILEIFLISWIELFLHVHSVFLFFVFDQIITCNQNYSLSNEGSMEKKCIQVSNKSSQFLILNFIFLECFWNWMFWNSNTGRDRDTHANICIKLLLSFDLGNSEGSKHPKNNLLQLNALSVELTVLLTKTNN